MTEENPRLLCPYTGCEIYRNHQGVAGTIHRMSAGTETPLAYRGTPIVYDESSVRYFCDGIKLYNNGKPDQHKIPECSHIQLLNMLMQIVKNQEE